MKSPVSLWEKTKKIIQNDVSDAAFETWIDPLILEKVEEETDTLFVKAESDYVVEIINARFLQMLEGAASLAFKNKMHIVATAENKNPLVVDNLDMESEKEPAGPDIDDTLGPSDDYSSYPDDELSQENYLNPRFNFGTFVVGENSSIAYEAARAVALRPGDKHLNPFFIYGGSGLGKTHLMHAIGHYILKNSNKKVLYVSSETFTNELIQVIGFDRRREGRGRNWRKKFRDKYRKIDILLIDDIQFLEGKEAIVEEFFNTFESLYLRNKQIVISSDRSPDDIKLDDRLTSRFKWAIKTDIQPPDYETRVAILISKAENEGIEVTPEVRAVIELIAEKIKHNVRELEGAFTQVITMAPLMGQTINVAFAKNMLKNVFVEGDSKVSIQSIKRNVCKFYNIKLQDMDSKKRLRSIAYPRQIAMYLAKEMTDASLPKIGDSFGGRDHTTVLYACNKIREDLKTNEELREDIKDIKDLIH